MVWYWWVMVASGKRVGLHGKGERFWAYKYIKTLGTENEKLILYVDERIKLFSQG